MTRRLLGPVGGPILYVLVACSVFGVLGWVTHSALQVEKAQREAAARAELGSNLRVALWRLDGRMLPALGVEYSRPFYHYGPADPMYGYGFAATPLLTTDLPDWMKLHFQLDAVNGWDSPQVLSADVVERIREAWGLPLQNVNEERKDVLTELRTRFPVRSILDNFASRDRALSGDSLSSSTPLVPGDVVPHPESTTPSPAQPAVETSPLRPTGSLDPTTKQTSVPTSSPAPFKRDTIHLFGIEVCLCSDKPTANNQSSNQLQPGPNDSLKKSDGTNPGQPGVKQGIQQQTFSQRNGRMPASKDENPTKAEAFNREAETINRGLRDVPPPPGNYRFLENSNPLQNTVPGTNDPKMAGNGMASQPIPGGTNNTLPALAGGANSIAQPMPKNAAIPVSGPAQMQNPSTPVGTSGKTQGNTAPTQPSSSTSVTPKGIFKEEKNIDLTRNEKSAGTDGKGMTEMLADAAKLAKSEADRKDKRRAETIANGENLKDVHERAAVPTGGMPPPTIPPASNANPVHNEPGATVIPASGTAPLVSHLGSMWPEWLAGTDGSEMLVLVRVAKVDNKDVCQGIILDWTKLESVLKDEVKDLFPDAKLVPIKDSADISPDRVMTALPIQLDPGPQPEPPPAGLTTLRLGLLLAWAAAIIAFVAVGFCGWTLIDLAERRIRFVSAVTHELRTPLTSLRLYLDLLVSGMIQDEAKKQEYLNTLTIESDRLHRLIDNVLDFARLEKRRKEGDKQPIKVVDLIEQVRQTWNDRLIQEGRELAVISTLPMEQEVKTDASMVQQIIANLIDNARKYSRDAVDKRIWVWAKPNGSKSVAIEIEDRGPGVPANERRSIFKPFRRGEQADKTSGGAGLGLALAKSWAEVLGGKLSHRPADGGTGACFRLELPVG